MTSPDTDSLITALRRPEAYSHAVGESVGFLQTHISLLFFAGDRVYKVKKPVDLGFLDYTTLEKRRDFCVEEVRLNRRLASQTYLGVAPILPGRTGLRVGEASEDPDTSNGAVEFAVAMRRLPATRMMDQLLEEHAIDNGLIRALADKLTTFHAEAATGPGVDEHGSFVAISQNVLENFEQTRSVVGTLVSAKLHAHLESTARRDLEVNRHRMESRLAGGRVRDGHGDLHAGNVCFIEADDIVIYDCIEFSPRFRCGDVACDLAFLTMDLDLRRLRGFSGFLARAYAERARDPELLTIEPFYKAYRAMVRAKVAAFKAAGAGVPETERHAAALEARRYFHLAASYTLSPALILVCGPPASGKSWVISPLSQPFEAAVLSSDRVRKRLAGIAETRRDRQGVEAGLYRPEMTDRTYATLRDKAEVHLRAGRTVLIDATGSTVARRAPFHALARDHGVPLLAVHLDPPESVIRERLEKRARDPHAISDANASVYESIRDRWEPLDELPSVVHWPHVDRAPEELVSALVDAWLDERTSSSLR